MCYKDLVVSPSYLKLLVVIYKKSQTCDYVYLS